MKLTGEKLIPLPQSQVWAALNDSEILRLSIPGCESFEKVSDNNFRATVTTRVGPVQAKFQGTVTLSDFDVPNGYTITGQGTGGAAGSAKGSARVTLSPAVGGTRLAWTADAQISGKLAQIGSRLIESAANMMAGQFFDRFQRAVGGDVSAAVAKPGFPVPQLIWWLGAAVIAAGAAYFIWR
jgi:carbon monoxide dehydrogenase subunit G